MLIPPMSFHGLFQIIVHGKFRSSVENQKDYQNVFTEHSKEETNMKIKKINGLFTKTKPFIQTILKKMSHWPVITPESWFPVQSVVDFCNILLPGILLYPMFCILHVTITNYPW